MCKKECKCLGCKIDRIVGMESELRKSEGEVTVKDKNDKPIGYLRPSGKAYFY